MDQLTADGPTGKGFGDVLATRDLMRLTGMKEVTVWRWLKKGTLPGHLIGGSWIVYHEEVRAKLADSAQQPKEPAAFLAMFDDVLKIGDAQALFGKTRQTIYKWLNQGSLPGHQLGTSWVMYRHEMREILIAGSNQVPKTDPQPEAEKGLQPIRRLDRSRAVITNEIGLHEDVAEEFKKAAHEQGVSLGLYLEQLLTLTRDESGRLPTVFANQKKVRTQRA